MSLSRVDAVSMTCFLLHMIEQPDPRPYDDSELKDLIGSYPRCFCASSQPPTALKPSESIRCFDRDKPCWDLARARNARVG